VKREKRSGMNMPPVCLLRKEGLVEIAGVCYI
jgi:hypothetical protein